MAPKDEERRQQILDAAQKVFAAKGFDGPASKTWPRPPRFHPACSTGTLKTRPIFLCLSYPSESKKLFGTLLPESVSFDLPPDEFLPQFGRLHRPFRAAHERRAVQTPSGECPGAPICRETSAVKRHWPCPEHSAKLL